MRTSIIRILAAVLTFSVGVASFALINSFRGLWTPANSRRPSLIVSLEPSIPGSPIKLSGVCGCQKDTEIGGVSKPTDSSNQPRTVSGGILNGKATSLPRPAYPPVAKTARVSGTVAVQIIVDENGCVVSAYAVSGHPLLQAAAVQAATKACFSPTRLRGEPVRVSGVVTYNFLLS